MCRTPVSLTCRPPAGPRPRSGPRRPELLEPLLREGPRRLAGLAARAEAHLPLGRLGLEVRVREAAAAPASRGLGLVVHVRGGVEEGLEPRAQRDVGVLV